MDVSIVDENIKFNCRVGIIIKNLQNLFFF